MMNNTLKQLSFAWYCIKINIANNIELRQSFLLNMFGMILNNTAFTLMWVCFATAVGDINGWSVYDVVGMQGFVALSYGLIDSFGAGIVMIADHVFSGSFDRFLLSPKNVFLRVATSKFEDSALGDILFGIICLLIFGYFSQPNIEQIVLMLVMISVSIVIFFSVMVIANTFCFFFSDARALAGIITEIFFTPSLFHGGAFQGTLRFFYIFIIPTLLLGTIPVEVVRDLSMEKLILAVILAIIWPILALKFFYYGIKKYESSGFMTFGS